MVWVAGVKQAKKTGMGYGYSLKGQSSGFVHQLKRSPLEVRKPTPASFNNGKCIAPQNWGVEGASELHRKLTTVAQQWYLESVSLRLGSAFYEAASPQDQVPCGCTTAGSPESECLLVSCPAGERGVLTPSTESIGCFPRGPSQLSLHIFLSQSGSVSPCSVARAGVCWLARTSRGPSLEPRGPTSAELLFPDIQGAVSEGREGTERRWPSSPESLSNHPLGYEEI